MLVHICPTTLRPIIPLVGARPLSNKNTSFTVSDRWGAQPIPVMLLTTSNLRDLSWHFVGEQSSEGGSFLVVQKKGGGARALQTESESCFCLKTSFTSSGSSAMCHLWPLLRLFFLRQWLVTLSASPCIIQFFIASFFQIQEFCPIQFPCVPIGLIIGNLVLG